jgi:hypothetical protein
MQGLHLAREYLQARILGSLQRAGGMIPLAFQGGTALRFLYDLPRFSEDLDFALVDGRAAGFQLKPFLVAIERELKLDDLAAEVTFNEKTVVQKASFRFRGLAHSLGLSPHWNQTLTIRFEVDSRPPAGAEIATTIVRRHELLHLQHHDKSSLLAGKLHAILNRPYAKGRDYYDLIWYLGDRRWPEPNLTLLNNALAQTGWSGDPLTSSNWRRALVERARGADWKAVRADVAPFLERPVELELMTLSTVEKILEEDRTLG